MVPFENSVFFTTESAILYKFRFNNNGNFISFLKFAT